MSDKTGIEWTDATWNCIRGCSRVSVGCMNCYAERQAIRQIGSGYAGLIKRTSHGPAWTGEVRCIPELLDQPLKWKTPRRVFVNSMSDLFHESVPFSFVDDVFAVMALAPRHTFQVLTKRPARMQQYMTAAHRNGTLRRDGIVLGRAWSMLGMMPKYKHERVMQRPWPLPNVWLGVSVEDQATADERIPLLLQTPAAVRFVSYEPALGPVDFRAHFTGHCAEHDFASGFCLDRAHPGVQHLHWVIVGGESGPKARPCDIAWIQSAVDQCKAAGVACFVKQLGAKSTVMVGTTEYENSFVDRKGGDMAEWPQALCVREFPR